MADTLLTGTTLVEKESRSVGDIPVGGIVEWDDTFSAIPENFRECNGETVNDPSSPYVGTAVPDLNTNYWTTTGLAFVGSGTSGDGVDGWNYEENIYGTMHINDSITVAVSVNLPHGAVVTSCIVEGDAGSEDTSWTLLRRQKASTTDTEMATANIGTADTSIYSATIDNATYSYFIKTGTLANHDDIFGTTIIYTPRFKFIIRIK